MNSSSCTKTISIVPTTDNKYLGIAAISKNLNIIVNVSPAIKTVCIVAKNPESVFIIS